MTATPTTTTVLSYIRHWINRARAETASDAALLRRFTQEGDEDAFALLMDRHGAMVLGAGARTTLVLVGIVLVIHISARILEAPPPLWAMKKQKP